MRYEVHFGGFTHWCDAATPQHAGLLTLDACIEEWKTFPQSPMMAINLDSDETTTVGLAEILWIKHHASQELPAHPSEEAELAMETQWMNGELSP